MQEKERDRHIKQYFSCTCKLRMPPENGRQEVTLFLSIAGCELLETFNGLQLAQAGEANCKTSRQKSEEPFTLVQKMKPGRERRSVASFP